MTHKQFCLWGIGIWIVGMFTGWNFYYDLHQTPQPIHTAIAMPELCSIINDSTICIDLTKTTYAPAAEFLYTAMPPGGGRLILTNVYYEK